VIALLIVPMMISLARALREDWLDEARREREMRKRMREMIVK
jgi:glycine betaine transporter